MATLVVYPGKSVYLVPGETYTAISGLVGPYFALPAGCSIIGRLKTTDPYPVLRLPPTNQGYAYKVTSNDTTLQGFQQIGGGIFSEATKNLTVDDIESEQTATSGKKCGLEISAAIEGLKVTRCRFTGNNGAFAIFSASALIRALIANNEFISLRAGMHLASDSPTVLNNVIEQNYMRGIVAQAFELQGAGTGWMIQDNWVEYHNLLASGNNDAYSYSLPLAGASGTSITNNVSIQKRSADELDKIGVRIIFEMGGKNVLVQNNYSDGGNHVIAGNGAGGTGVASANLIKNYREAPRNANGNTTAYTNNGDAVKLVPDLIARGRPQRFSRYGAVVPPVVVEDPEKVALRAENAALKLKIAKAMEDLK